MILTRSDQHALSSEMDDLSAERRLVLEWRQEQFELLGLEPDLADLLAAGDADLNVARRLAGSGCDPTLLYLILG